MINENAIKLLVQTAGWKEVEKIFIDEVVKYNLIDSFDATGKSNEQIALECRARKIASEIVKSQLDKINVIGGKKAFEKESFI